MKHLLLTTIAAVVLVGCGESQPPELPTAKAPDISIWDAAADGNTEAVKQHLAAGTDVNDKDEGGKTPLDRASEAAPLNRAMTTEAANLLRKHGGKTGEELEAGEPVAEAAKPERQARKVPDTIHRAAGNGNIEAVKKHLAAGTDVNAKDDKFGTTPLHSAAGAGRKEIVELLIAEGADVNAKGWATGGTPLLIAAMEGHNEVVELLISKGADVDARQYGNGLTPLHFAALGDHKETAELLIAEGADVNAKDVNLRKPAVGRDIQVRHPGRTPLDTAIRRKHPEITDLLRKHGGKTAKELKAEGK